MRAIAIWLSLLACTLTGCAGFRGGWESVAYIGDAPPSPIEPATSAYERSQRPPLSLPGMSLQVSIDNRVRDYDTQVWFFAVPVKVDPRNVQTSVAAPGKTRVRLAITPTQPGLVFSPRQAVLTFGGRQYQAVAGYEFGQFAVDPSRPAQWEYREVPTDMPLHAVQEQYLLSIDFGAPSPSPEAADITIDLSRALRAPGLAEVPLIRFVPVRWKEGYT
jgi:hypothetical protein